MSDLINDILFLLFTFDRTNLILLKINSIVIALLSLYWHLPFSLFIQNRGIVANGAVVCFTFLIRGVAI
jgi:hypothetical protein